MKTILKILLVAVCVAGVLNWEYFWKNLSFTLNPAQIRIDAMEGAKGEKGESNRLEILSLGIAAPIVYPEKNEEAAYQEALIAGVAHYPGTALPGEPGNVYIFGHSSDYLWRPGDYKTVFALLPRIKIGAEIILTNSLGKNFHYKVTSSFAVGAGEVKWLDQGDYQKKLLTLQTSYPVGTALRRWIVRAELSP